MQTYIQNIELAFLLLPTILFLTFVPFIFYQYKKLGYANGKRTLVLYLFIFYIIVAYFMVILPLPKITSNFCELRSGNISVSFEFFRFIKEMITENGGNLGLISLLKTKTFMVTAFNFLLLLPLGFFLRYLYKLKWAKVLLIAFLTSLFFEISQLSGLFGIYPCPYRLFEIDDLMTNTAGAMLGFFLFKYINFLPALENKKVQSFKEANLTQRFLVNIFDFLLFSFFLNIVMNGGESILSSIFWTVFVFAIYYLLVPMRLGTTVAGKFLGLKLLAKDSKSNIKSRFIFYGTLVLFPILTSSIFNYIVINTKENGIYAIASFVVLALWFIFVVLKSFFGKKKGLHNILSKSRWVNFRNKK